MTSQEIARTIIEAFKRGNKLLICGNGGSSTMASHFAGEFLGHFEKERKPLPAIALNDPAALTAIANDYGYKYVFSRQIEALGKEGDVLIGLSTSGRSKNILNAIITANLNKMIVIDFPREGIGAGNIQNFQLKLMHEVCRIVEQAFI